MTHGFNVAMGIWSLLTVQEIDALCNPSDLEVYEEESFIYS